MRWSGLGYRSFFTVTLLILDQSHQFDLSRLMASKPCDQSDIQPWSASDATSEVGTGG